MVKQNLWKRFRSFNVEYGIDSLFRKSVKFKIASLTIWFKFCGEAAPPEGAADVGAFDDCGAIFWRS